MVWESLIEHSVGMELTWAACPDCSLATGQSIMTASVYAEIIIARMPGTAGNIFETSTVNGHLAIHPLFIHGINESCLSLLFVISGYKTGIFRVKIKPISHPPLTKPQSRSLYIYKRALATFEREVLRGRTDINRAAMSTSVRVMGNDRLRAGGLPIVSEVVED